MSSGLWKAIAMWQAIVGEGGSSKSAKLGGKWWEHVENASCGKLSLSREVCFRPEASYRNFYIDYIDRLFQKCLGIV